MLAPALIYLAFNAGGPGSSGWGIPVATDIAVAVGVVSLLGSAVDPALKLFLLALAIVDDIGAIVIIAVFYAGGIDARAALVAVAVVGLVIACRAAGVRAIAVYVVLGVALWVATYETGIHATIAGVILGLLTPARGDGPSGSVVERLEHRLHPWSSFVIVPLFALANAGVPITATALADAWSSSITHGVVVGLVVGKLVGVTAFTWLAVQLRIGALPAGVSWRQFVGIGAVAGIGFTVSLFVTGLAFTDQALRDDAKIGILAASAIAGILGTLILRRTSRRVGPAPAGNLAP
jgi:NhaA family Na+:H+ antiporter